MKLQQLMSQTRRAIDDYGMIHTGDKIAIGISGGKDSLTLLYALHGLQRFYPEKFDLEAITVDLGNPDFDLSHIRHLCETMQIQRSHRSCLKNGKKKIHALCVQRCEKAH